MKFRCKPVLWGLQDFINGLKASENFYFLPVDSFGMYIVITG